MGTYEKFLIYIEEFEYISDYSNEEVGELLRALIHFVKTGEEPFLAEKLRCPFRFMSAHIKRDRESYTKMIEKKRAGGKKGAEVRYGKKYDDTEGKFKNKSDEKESSAQKEAKNCVQAQNQSLESKNINGETENNVTVKTKVEQRLCEKFDKFCECCSKKQENAHEKTKNDVNLDVKPDEYSECKQENNATQNQKNDTSLCFMFDEFWECYPKKQDKEAAKNAYFDLCPDIQTHKKIIEALKHHKKTDEWQRENGRFVPHPSKWLIGSRWEDKIEKNPGGISTEDSFYVDAFVQAAINKSTRGYE